MDSETEPDWPEANTNLLGEPWVELDSGFPAEVFLPILVLLFVVLSFFL